MSGQDWESANQRLLQSEFARLTARVSREDAAPQEREVQTARAAMPARAAIDTLVDVLGLTSFEKDVLLLCAGVQLNVALAAACKRTAVDQPVVTFGLALDTLSSAHWSATAPAAPLRRWRLIEVGDVRALTTCQLSIDERILHYLAGINCLDARLNALVSPIRAGGLLVASQESVVETAYETLSKRSHAGGVVQLLGDDLAGGREVARRIADRLGLKLYSLRIGEMADSADVAEAIAVLWTREALLLRAALFLHFDDVKVANAVRLAERAGGLVFICSPHALNVDRPDLRLGLTRPKASEQKRLWTAALGDVSTRLNGSLDAVSSRFKLNAETIEHAAAAVRAEPASESNPVEALWKACRDSVRQRLGELAQEVEPRATWEDLVLPDFVIGSLRQIAAQVRQRAQVYEAWGFAEQSARGLGVSVLFTGESGTGKTMAAEVLANELGLELYRIDLAAMVSKYIGETEKNLRRVFDAAEEGGVILLFDEADALFGKRGDVKDSHDRYANIEVSYLLQRMEAYRGLAILTTNFKGALDTAFQRRLRFVLPFPFPDQDLRERIWRRAFPDAAPLRNLDHRKLAQLNIAGGGIRNVALNAAFLAADSGEAIGMSHLLAAARSEAAKRDRPFSEAETRGWT
jgi:hypothetical protein